MNLERLYHQIIDPNRKPLHEPVFQALSAVSAVYGAAMNLRARGYATGWFSGRKLDCRVISVGNLTLGGTGKTPMTLWLASSLRERGFRPAILSRGYKGNATGVGIVSEGAGPLMTPAEAGDEPVMMAERLPGVPVLVGSDRYASGRVAIQKFGCDVAVLDDGFQHLALERDCNILLLDHANPFGNGRLFPSGHLREPAEALGRADVVCFTRCQEGRADPELPRPLPVVKSRPRLAGWRKRDSQDILPLKELAGKTAAAFCGIARPGDFFSLLSRHGLNAVRSREFPDHHPYSAEDFARVQEEALREGAECIVTTEKDAVKSGGFSWKLPLLAAVLELEVFQGEQILLDAAIGQGAGRLS